MATDYASLTKFCTTDHQRKVIELLASGKSTRKTADIFGCSNSSIDTLIRRLKDKSIDLHFPEDIYDTSTLKSYKDESSGKTILQWEKRKADAVIQERFRQQALDAFHERLPRLAAMRESIKKLDSGLVNQVTLTDAHIGAYATKLQGGADWNLQIAEQTLIKVFDSIYYRLPKAETCFLSLLGDISHLDSIFPFTPTSHNHIDSDGGYFMAVPVIIRVVRHLIARALSTHKKVIISCEEGNHDLSAHLWLGNLIRNVYENEPRLEVLLPTIPYSAWHKENLMLGFHHGHKNKPADLPLIFATQLSEHWGGPKMKRHIHTGHRHHFHDQDISGVRVTQHTTVAARDSHAIRAAYESMRFALGITYDTKYGQSGSVQVSPEMIA